MKESANGSKYSPLKIQQFKMWLEEMKEKGNAQYFEVFVDDFKVIPRTDAVEDFERHEQYIDEETKKVTVLTYSTPGSHRYKQYTFLLNEQTPSAQQGSALNGPEVTEMIKEKVQMEKERWACELVKKELEDTRGKLGEAEEYIGKLQAILRDTEGKLKEANEVGGIAQAVKELAPHFLSLKKENTGGFAGAKVENPLAGQQGKPGEAASFSKAGAGATLSENEKRYLQLGKMLEEKFTEQEFGAVFFIIEQLEADRSKIQTVSESLRHNDNSKKTQP